MFRDSIDQKDPKQTKKQIILVRMLAIGSPHRTAISQYHGMCCWLTNYLFVYMLFGSKMKYTVIEIALIKIINENACEWF